MTKNSPTGGYANVETVESYIIETLSKEGKVVIPDFGYLELRLIGDRHTAFFNSFDDKDSSSLQTIHAGTDKENINNLHAFITTPLKEEKIVNLPRVGIFRPVRREDGKIRISFIPSSYLRKQLNQEKEVDEITGVEEVREIEEVEEVKELGGIDTDKSANVDENSFKDDTPQIHRSSVSSRQKTHQVDDSHVNHDHISEKRRGSRNLSGSLLFIVAVVIVALFAVYIFLFSGSNKKIEDPVELIQPSEPIDLFSLAEQHYGHRAFWVYIYETNSDSSKVKSPLKSPINIPRNITLVIPDLKTEYQVDITDSLEIQRAMIKADIELNKMKNKYKKEY